MFSFLFFQMLVFSSHGLFAVHGRVVFGENKNCRKACVLDFGVLYVWSKRADSRVVFNAWFVSFRRPFVSVHLTRPLHFVFFFVIGKRFTSFCCCFGLFVSWCRASLLRGPAAGPVIVWNFQVLQVVFCFNDNRSGLSTSPHTPRPSQGVVSLVPR